MIRVTSKIRFNWTLFPVAAVVVWMLVFICRAFAAGPAADSAGCKTGATSAQGQASSVAKPASPASAARQTISTSSTKQASSASTAKPAPSACSTKPASSVKKAASAGFSQSVDCSKLPAFDVFISVKYDRETMRKIQMCLKVKDFYTAKLDGIKGPLTIEAMRKYSAAVPSGSASSSGKENPFVDYSLTSRDLEKLKTFNDLVAQLQALRDTTYENKYELMNAVKEAFKDVTDQYDQYVETITGNLDQLKTYKLTEKNLAALKSENIPDTIIEMLRELQDEEFPDKDSLVSAVKGKLKEASDPVNSFKEKVLKEIDETDSYYLTDQFFDKIEATAVPEVILKRLKVLQDIEYPNSELFRNALETYVLTPMKENKELKPSSFESYRALILAKARKERDFKSNKGIHWKGWSCGCYLDNFGGEVSYGFYPFWKAGDTQKIDFSSFSRIGYFALTFDWNGNIPSLNHWQREPQKEPGSPLKAVPADFINEARRYRTAVDLVFYKNDWNGWKQEAESNRTLFVDTLTNNMVRLVGEKLDNRLMNRIQPIMSLGSSAVPTMGDGITIYFEGYPRDDDFNEFFQLFIHELRKKLRLANKKFKLNVVLPADDLGKLATLRDEVDLFLIFLKEPTTDTKKALRQKVEEMFKGTDRQQTLRKIVPVLVSGVQNMDQARFHQFGDDLIYFQDNFGGVGFWTIPTNKENGAAEMNDAIKKAFVRTDNGDFFQTKLNSYFPWLTRFVGPNRWYIRLVLDILVAIILVGLFLSYLIFEVRDFFRKHFPWCIGACLAAFLLQMSLFIGDPYWANRTTETLFISILVLAGIGILFYIRRIKLTDLP